jgi:transcriptional antiterminator RfaH
MSVANARFWYVVQTQTRAELKAAGHLLRQGFEPYLPSYLKRRRHARRTDIVAAPLFPCYVFVSTDLTMQRWRTIHSTAGVARLICNGEEPARVADAIIDGMMASQDESGYLRLLPRPEYRSGDKVRVFEGVFASCLALFEGMTDGERVAILLDLLGRKVRVSIRIDAIAVA